MLANNCLVDGIFEIQKNEKHFSISPNPSNGRISISFENAQKTKYDIEVFDVNGNLDWATSYGSSGADQAKFINSDDKNNIFIFD